VKFVIAKAARDDISQIVAWYDERSNVAGDRFLIDLNKIFCSICEHPTQWRPLKPGENRRTIHLEHFPYSVIYKLTEKQIRILVVRHDGRNEGFGLDRI
tara:strand:+ start:1437 stop:1733 length:297 start_codon:yes stop_codon:yes gene_type:complete